MPRTGLPVSCDIYHPFGTLAPTQTAVVGTFYDDLPCGRGSGQPGLLIWSNFLDVAEDVLIVDGCTRYGGSDAMFYSDGDEVRIPTQVDPPVPQWRYVVVWAAKYMDVDTSDIFQRVYLLRDSYIIPT